MSDTEQSRWSCWTLGQDETCEIRVADPYVSGRHARITRKDSGVVTIEDLGSTNGTYVSRGGTTWRVWGPREIQPGDVIWLGGRTTIPWTTEVP